MSGDIFEFDDKARVERLVGTLHDPAATPGDVLTVQTGGAIAAAPGGGSTPVQAQYNGLVSGDVPDGGQIPVTWDALGSGTELLDRSDPAHPVFLAAGTYAISIVCTADHDPSAGGWVSATLGVGVQSFTQATAFPLHDFCISTVAVITADDLAIFEVDMNNNDGLGIANKFSLAAAVIVKLA